MKNADIKILDVTSLTIFFLKFMAVDWRSILKAI